MFKSCIASRERGDRGFVVLGVMPTDLFHYLLSTIRLPYGVGFRQWPSFVRNSNFVSEIVVGRLFSKIDIW